MSLKPTVSRTSKRKRKQLVSAGFYIEEKEYEDVDLYYQFDEALKNNPYFYGTAQHYTYILRCIIAEHNYCYYVLGEPIISDHRYDELYRKLQETEAKFPQVFHEQSPTRTVGSGCIEWPPPGQLRTDLFANVSSYT